MADSNRGGALTAIVIALLTAGSTPFWVKPVGRWLGFVVPSGTNDGTDDGTPKPKTVMGPLKPGVILNKYDIGPGVVADDTKTCAATCLDEKRCVTVTFLQSPTDGTGICYQHDQVAPEEHRADATSAYKVYRSGT